MEGKGIERLGVADVAFNGPNSTVRARTKVKFNEKNPLERGSLVLDLSRLLDGLDLFEVDANDLNEALASLRRVDDARVSEIISEVEAVIEEHALLRTDRLAALHKVYLDEIASFDDLPIGEREQEENREKKFAGILETYLAQRTSPAYLAAAVDNFDALHKLICAEIVAGRKSVYTFVPIIDDWFKKNVNLGAYVFTARSKKLVTDLAVELGGIVKWMEENDGEDSQFYIELSPGLEQEMDAYQNRWQWLREVRRDIGAVANGIREGLSDAANVIGDILGSRRVLIGGSVAVGALGAVALWNGIESQPDFEVESRARAEFVGDLDGETVLGDIVGELEECVDETASLVDAAVDWSLEGETLQAFVASAADGSLPVDLNLDVSVQAASHEALYSVPVNMDNLRLDDPSALTAGLAHMDAWGDGVVDGDFSASGWEFVYDAIQDSGASTIRDAAEAIAADAQIQEATDGNADVVATHFLQEMGAMKDARVVKDVAGAEQVLAQAADNVDDAVQAEIEDPSDAPGEYEYQKTTSPSVDMQPGDRIVMDGGEYDPNRTIYETSQLCDPLDCPDPTFVKPAEKGAVSPLESVVAKVDVAEHVEADIVEKPVAAAARSFDFIDSAKVNAEPSAGSVRAVEPVENKAAVKMDAPVSVEVSEKVAVVPVVEEAPAKKGWFASAREKVASTVGGWMKKASWRLG